MNSLINKIYFIIILTINLNVMFFKNIKITFILVISLFLFLTVNNAKSQFHSDINSYFNIPINESKQESYYESGYLWGLWGFCAPESDYEYGNKYADLYFFLPYFNGPTFKEFAKGTLNCEKSNSWLYGTTGCNVQSLKIAESNLDEFISNLFFDLGMPDDQILLKDIENIRIKLLENRHNDEDEFAWYVQMLLDTAASIRVEKDKLAKLKEEEKIKAEKKLISETIINTNAGLIQSALKNLGFYEGPIDSDFGKASLSALLKWKVSNGLEENNMISQDEFDLLKKQALSEKSVSSNSTKDEKIKIMKNKKKF